MEVRPQPDQLVDRRRVQGPQGLQLSRTNRSRPSPLSTRLDALVALSLRRLRCHAPGAALVAQGRPSPTRPHPEHGRAGGQRPQYCPVYPGGTIGRRQGGSPFCPHVTDRPSRRPLWTPFFIGPRPDYSPAVGFEAGAAPAGNAPHSAMCFVFSLEGAWELKAESATTGGSCPRGAPTRRTARGSRNPTSGTPHAASYPHDELCGPPGRLCRTQCED